MKAPPDATGSRNVLFGYAERKRVSRHLAVVSVGPETAYSNSSSSKLNSTKTNQSNSRRVFHQQQLEKKYGFPSTDGRTFRPSYIRARKTVFNRLPILPQKFDWVPVEALIETILVALRLIYSPVSV